MPSKPTANAEGQPFDHTSLTCKAFAALLCVSGVAAGCITLVAALKTQDPIGVYRPDAVRRELPRNGPFMAVETANPHGLHGPGAVSPTKQEFQAHLGSLTKGRGSPWHLARRQKGKGGGHGKGRGCHGKGCGHGSPFGHAGMRGPTGDFLWERGAGRRGHHVESGIGPMQVQAADYDEEEARGKVRNCLLNLDRSGAPMVPQHGQSAPLVAPGLGSCGSSGHAWRLCAARHAQGRGQATGRPATASGARASCLQNHRVLGV